MRKNEKFDRMDNNTSTTQKINFPSIFASPGSRSRNPSITQSEFWLKPKHSLVVDDNHSTLRSLSLQFDMNHISPKESVIDWRQEAMLERLKSNIKLNPVKNI